MLEIILIIFFAKKIGSIAENKGHKKGAYIALAVVFWVVGEFMGAIVGAIVTGDTGLGTYFFALVGAAVGALVSYLLVNGLQDRSIHQKPDSHFAK